MGESSRDRILQLLKKSDQGMTMEQLCAALDVTPMAVHRQLKMLEGGNFISTETVRQNRGRPLHVYRLTQSADEYFPKRYSHLLLDLLKEVRWKEGADKVRRMFESRFKSLLTAARGRIHGVDFGANVAKACSILQENGYMAENERISSKKYRIKLYNCPTPQVAREFPEICACEKCFLSDLLNANVVRDRHILSGHNYCSYIAEKKL